MSSFSQHVDAAPPHLLLIDDDLSLGTLIREYCEGKGLKVTAAATGEEGICGFGSVVGLWAAASQITASARMRPREIVFLAWFVRVCPNLC